MDCVSKFQSLTIQKLFTEMFKEWQKDQLWQDSFCCTADSNVKMDQNHLYNNGKKHLACSFLPLLDHW